MSVSWSLRFSCGCIKPRLLGTIFILEHRKTLGVLMRARDVVESFEQAFLAHRMNFEPMDAPFCIRDGLRTQIDGDGRTGPLVQLPAHLAHLRFRQYDG